VQITHSDICSQRAQLTRFVGFPGCTRPTTFLTVHCSSSWQLVQLELVPWRYCLGLGSVRHAQASYQLGVVVEVREIAPGRSGSHGLTSRPSDAHLRIPSLVQAVPCIFQVILIWFVPESPRWLISKGRVRYCESSSTSLRAVILTDNPQDQEAIQIVSAASPRACVPASNVDGCSSQSSTQTATRAMASGVLPSSHVHSNT